MTPGVSVRRSLGGPPYATLVLLVATAGSVGGAQNATAPDGPNTTVGSVVVVDTQVVRGGVTSPPPVSGGILPVPFAAGEAARYDVKFGVLHVGEASTTVAHSEDVRGRAAWHTQFRLKGGTLFYHVDDLFESWIDQATFSSLRFYQTQQEGSKDRQKRYEIYPDQGTYVEMDKRPTRSHPGVKDPLDDGSFLFFIRTLPLIVGHTYEWNRYFRPERNPVRIRVLRKETIQVPAGTFHCIVVQPVIKTKGIFSEDGQAQVWLTDDPRHVVVQLKSRLTFGSINLYLRSYTPGA